MPCKLFPRLGSWHRLLPPCALQRPVAPRALLSLPGSWQYLPPPCALQRSVLRSAPLSHHSTDSTCRRYALGSGLSLVVYISRILAPARCACPRNGAYLTPKFRRRSRRPSTPRPAALLCAWFRPRRYMCANAPWRPPWLARDRRRSRRLRSCCDRHSRLKSRERACRTPRGLSSQGRAICPRNCFKGGSRQKK